jgi:hypothetical protein
MNWFTKRRKPMFKAIEGFEEMVAAKVKAAEDEVKSFFNSKKAKAIVALKADIEHFKESILEDGIKIDEAFEAELEGIKAKLQAELETLKAPQ